VFGSPNLGEIRGVFVGVENGIDASVCTEVWINELRLSNIDEKVDGPPWRVDLALSDLGNISISVNTIPPDSEAWSKRLTSGTWMTSCNLMRPPICNWENYYLNDGA
jgi:cell surface protein SprA